VTTVGRIRQERVTFTGSAGFPLVGVLDLPQKEPEAYALFAHCFTGGKDSPAARRVARALVDRGMAVLRFDFAGVGESGGEFHQATFSSNVADIRLAAVHLRENFAPASLIMGHSFGGAAVLAAAGDIPEAAAVVSIGAPSDPAHVTHLFADSMAEIRARGQAEVSVGGRPFMVGKQLLDDLAEHQQAERIARLHRPLLVLHSPNDEIVGIDNAAGIYAAAKHPKSFVSLDGADHLLTHPRHAKRAAQVIAAWADPYLPETFTPEID
jgi:alpha/beta superfamily hydrolase